MADNKTVATTVPPREFIAGVVPEVRRKDALVLLEIMEEITGQPATMWGPSMIGFGNHHYAYESGREGDTFAVGFSPRKTSLVLYGLLFDGADMSRLGKFKSSVACVYITRLSDVDIDELERLIREGFELFHNS
ncbi:DUF1801 domain-containing protein [Arthrobacter sp. 35W]|uniref:DUF1801 domain-containing protein n=1 Tax=Arthrobacter sp. 35W TaxID=1132441 RepID=UPI00040FA7D7|nr:DUF1801 domain-containing protein [Arthrobacter sp. 35W]